MANVEFRSEQGGAVPPPTGEGAARFLTDVRAWADRNGFERVVFRQDGDKLWVQLGDDELHYWMPRQLLERGAREDVEMQLDYARGAQRRSAAGYQKFDK